ncbi:MFS transporter [Tropicibacter sp. Alg240-R139]|uniref:MFS transporter n=1 Tax=Tropicibacter sp. Alg240-R139 TaxID=2305991 RepID=UPI0013DEF172|nr:MFS transporter [Tropicibacter sp. Alg240-R139]
MLSVLKHRGYRHMFLAQVVALLGTGLATVALGLLAFDLAGDQASLVLGTALTIKMIAYVTLAPIAAAFAGQMNRRTLLVALDIVRAVVALCLPFVTEVWQIYVLIFLLQAASAGFTPTFQATIPDLLPDEDDYTNALSLSRLAYDLENLLSPMLAAALLSLVAFDTLFVGTSVGFVASALLIVTIALPSPKPSKRRGVWDRTTRGMRIYLATPRLRGFLAFCMTVSLVGAMVLVNTVVIVRSDLNLSETAVALALGSFGAGSMLVALLLPRVLRALSDRSVMTFGAALMSVTALVLAAWSHLLGLSLPAVLLVWLLIGVGFSAVMTPSGRLLRRSSQPEDRPALFAAQFTLSHACWLIAYPLSGWLMSAYGATVTLMVLGVGGFASLGLALVVWPGRDPDVIAHSHPELLPDHPHLKGGHSHPYVIDDLHRHWPGHHQTYR